MENSRAIKGADYAREAIAIMARETRSEGARRGLAKLAISRHGNYTPEGKTLWAMYLEQGCPSCAS